MTAEIQQQKRPYKSMAKTLVGGTLCQNREEDWRGKRVEEKEKRKTNIEEDVPKQALAHVWQVALSVNVIFVEALWTDFVVGREYCRSGKVLKNIVAVKNLDWRIQKKNNRDFVNIL